MAKSTRLFDLMQVLRRHRFAVPGTVLAREAGVSLRTIYRDIAALQAMGADIQGEPGVGYVMRPGFLLPPLMFTEEEVQALALGAQWVRRQTDEGLALAAQDALAKIDSVLPDELKQKIHENAFHVGHCSAEAQPVDLKLVRRAMREQRKLQITYCDPQGAKTERVIWPIALGFFESRRIIASWCELRNDFRTFRTDRMERVALQADRYPDRRHDLVEQWRAKEAKERERKHRAKG